MNLRYGFVCDYAGLAVGGKPIAIGIFERVHGGGAGGEPIRFPTCFVLAALECSIAEGSEHVVTLRLVDDDGDLVHSVGPIPVPLTPSGIGLPLTAKMIMQLVGLTVPRLGDYTFEIHESGKSIGAGIPVSVVPSLAG